MSVVLQSLDVHVTVSEPLQLCRAGSAIFFVFVEKLVFIIYKTFNSIFSFSVWHLILKMDNGSEDGIRVDVVYENRERKDSNSERKTVRFDPEPKVVYLELEKVYDPAPRPSCLVRRRVIEYQMELLSRSNAKPPLPPRNRVDPLVELAEIFEQPLPPTPPPSPIIKIIKSKLRSKPRLNGQLTVTSRGVQHYRRDPALVNEIARGTAVGGTQLGNAALPTRFYRALSMNPHVPPKIPKKMKMLPPPPPPLQPKPSTSKAPVQVAVQVEPKPSTSKASVQVAMEVEPKPSTSKAAVEVAVQEEPKPSTSKAAVQVVVQVEPMANGQTQSDGKHHDDDSDKKHKGKCKIRNGRCKKCERADDNNHDGPGMRCLLFTIQCLGCATM